MSSVCILDYGSGNVKSVFNLVSAIAPDTVISNDAEQITRATHVILPGVGAFGAAMRKINERLPLDLLARVVLEQKKPFLGICVGMQVLATRGLEFGDFAGLGWIEGVTERLNPGELPLPHIGWNNTEATRPSPLLDGMGDSPDFYFVHSYAMRPKDPSRILATTQYGDTFCSAVQFENVYGVQFHPEKSQRTGARLIRNFLAVS